MAFEFFGILFEWESKLPNHDLLIFVQSGHNFSAIPVSV
jgi:hypothetical protein